MLSSAAIGCGYSIRKEVVISQGQSSRKLDGQRSPWPTRGNSAPTGLVPVHVAASSASLIP